jgi:hypothetical protein
MLSRRRLLAGLLGLGLARAQGLRAEEVVGALEVPWALVFLPDGGMLISERPGRIRLFRGGRLSTYAELPVYARGESGLLGLALHPRFPEAPYVYAYRTVEAGGLRNQVVRLRHLGERGVLERVILDGIPARPHGLHSGGRIAFGPDGMLYVTTGEVYERELAQDLASLGGEGPPPHPGRGARPGEPLPGPEGSQARDLQPGPPEPPGPGLAPRDGGALPERARAQRGAGFRSRRGERGRPRGELRLAEGGGEGERPPVPGPPLPLAPGLPPGEPGLLPGRALRGRA